MEREWECGWAGSALRGVGAAAIFLGEILVGVVPRGVTDRGGVERGVPERGVLELLILLDTGARILEQP